MTSGLIFMNGESHRQHRQMIMPAFHKKRIENYHQTMVDLTESFIAGWQAGQTFDIALEMQHLALEITSRILFGLDSGYDTRQLGEKFINLRLTYTRFRS
jgi:cytochrome P450